jgi:hypothetical protein
VLLLLLLLLMLLLLILLSIGHVWNLVHQRFQT